MNRLRLSRDGFGRSPGVSWVAAWPYEEQPGPAGGTRKESSAVRGRDAVEPPARGPSAGVEATAKAVPNGNRRRLAGGSNCLHRIFHRRPVNETSVGASFSTRTVCAGCGRLQRLGTLAGRHRFAAALRQRPLERPGSADNHPNRLSLNSRIEPRPQANRPRAEHATADPQLGSCWLSPL